MNSHTAPYRLILSSLLACAGAAPALAQNTAWTALNSVSEKDTFTFTIPIVARFASETGDPGQAGGAKGIQFNFPFVHLDRDN